MAETKAEKAQAERERKARIKRAQDRLAKLPDDEREAVLEEAAQKEGDARDAGSRRAHIAFVEDALVAWEVGGQAIAAAQAGKPLDTAAIARLVQKVSKDVRGDVGTPELREQALARVGELGMHARQAGAQKMAAEAVTEAAEKVAADVADGLRERARALRAEGLTLGEIAERLDVRPSVAHELVGDAPKGKPQKTAKAGKAAAPRAKRAPRESRGTGDKREEKCPPCGEWRPAQQDADGKYLKAADFREGRADCRSCYNKRWLEGKRARAQAAGK